MGISLDTLARYTPRLLLLHSKAFDQELKYKQRQSAWLQANIMNRLRQTRRTPVVTPRQLLGEAVKEAPSTKEEFILKARADAARRVLAQRKNSPFTDEG